MTPEEQLDRLIDQWEWSARLGPVESSDQEARLAAAEALMQHLEALVVPPAFAARLEARVCARPRSLAPQQSKVIPFPRSQAQHGRRQRKVGRRSRHPRGMRP